MNELTAIEREPRVRLEPLQLSRLRRVLAWTAARVPFYRDRLAAAGIGADGVRSLDDLSRLPFTAKSDFRDQYPYGLLAVPMEEVVRIHASSGTTGKPTLVAYTRGDLETWTQVMARTVAAGGVGPADVEHNACRPCRPPPRRRCRRSSRRPSPAARRDGSFDWVCSPNDTHACRVRAFVKNGIVTRLGNTYDYQTYADLDGNRATANWNPRQCAKGYTFHRVLYGPYRLKHPIVRKGWKAWADAGFPELTDELRTKYLFDARGQDEFVQISWEDAFTAMAKAMVAIAERYSGEDGKARLLAQGYQPEMIEAMGGAGTRTIKMRGGMGLLGVIGEQGLFPALVAAGVPKEDGPIGVMLAEHDDGRALVLALTGGPPSVRAEAARKFVALLRAHIDKENGVLFAIADAVLDDAAQARLAREFAATADELGPEASFERAAARLEALVEALGAVSPRP